MVFATVFNIWCLVQTPAQIAKVEITGNFGNEYTQGKMTVTDALGNATTYNIDGKWRGSSAKQYKKKSYAIKLTDENGNSIDASILGMRTDNSWILDAMAVDRARMRNRVSFDLWNDFATESYIKKKYEPESFNGTHGCFVELTVNSSYNGLYCLTEKIDRKQLKLKKFKKNEVRGTLYKAEGWAGTTFWDYKEFDNTKATWMDWSSQYPEIDDEGVTDYTPLANAIKFVIESSDEDFQNNVEYKFDLPVWMDYFLFIKLIYAIDNTGKNTFTYVYDQTKDPMLGIAPWDLDATWGRSYDGSELGHETINIANNLETRLLKDYTKGKEMMSDRYFALRKTLFASESLKSRFRRYFNLLNDNGVVERETKRWNGVDGIEIDIRSEMDYIEQWIDKRLNTMDMYFEKESTGIEKLENKDDNNSEAIYDIYGKRIYGKPIGKGIYIRNGKKFVVK